MELIKISLETLPSVGAQCNELGGRELTIDIYRQILELHLTDNAY